MLAYLVSKGFSSLNLAFFTHLPKPVGEAGGGMANAIVGTFELIGLASLIGRADWDRRGPYISTNTAACSARRRALPPTS